MRILHATKALWTGGIETMVCNLANEMSKIEDVSVCVFWKTDNKDVNSRLDHNVEFFDLGFSGKGKPIKEIFKFYSILRKEKYDIVHIHGFFYLYMLSIFLLHKKTKFVYTLHSDAYHEGTDWDNKLVAAKRFFFKKKWMYPICISNHAQQTFSELYRCDSVLIHNGIARCDANIFIGRQIIDTYRKTTETKVFLHPGRITKAKNQLVLCEVFDGLIKDGFDVVLLIAGGRQDPEVFNSISKYLSDRIIYLGERRNIPDLLAASDGMCLPSLFEGFGLVVVEALQQGCIPICTAVGGITDIVKDKENGILSKTTTTAGYLEAMTSFLSMTTEELKTMRTKAIESCSQFDISHTAERYIYHYNSILCKSNM